MGVFKKFYYVYFWGSVVSRNFHQHLFSFSKHISWKIVACVLLGCFLFWGQSTQPSKIANPLQSEKKSLPWSRLSQMTKPKLIESFAKKEQIEKDLLTFQPILHATVALALPEEESIPQQVSVILTLREGEELSGSMIHAIIDYLSGSLPGLDKNSISLSDNLGNVYAPANNISPSLLITKITTHLTHLLPKEHFTVNHIASSEHPRILLTINENYLKTFASPQKQQLTTHIEQYVSQVCPQPLCATLEVLPFAKHRKYSTWNKSITGLVILLLSLIITAAASCVLALHAYDRTSHVERKFKRGINITKLVELLQKEPPEKIALILSYLDPMKAQELINKLPEEKRNQVLKLQ